MNAYFKAVQDYADKNKDKSRYNRATSSLIAWVLFMGTFIVGAAAVVLAAVAAAIAVAIALFLLAVAAVVTTSLFAVRQAFRLLPEIACVGALLLGYWFAAN